MARHDKWKNDCHLKANDAYVAEHAVLCGCVHQATTYDQLNLPELASFELLFRRIQMIEEHHRHRLQSGGFGGGIDDEEEHLYYGTSTKRTGLMMAPELRDFVAEKDKTRAKIDKWRREAREERSLAATGSRTADPKKKPGG